MERLLYDAGLLRDIRPVGPAYSGGPVRRSGPMLHSPRQHLPVGTEDLVKGFSGVLQQVKGVGDLHGLRRGGGGPSPLGF